MIRNAIRLLAPALLAVLLAAGCRTTDKGGKSTSYIPVGPTELRKADAPIPEAAMLDIVIPVFTSDALPKSAVEAKQTSDSIRNAERHYMPGQLKKSLDASRNWGTVRIMPFLSPGHGFDIEVRGHIVDSANGRTDLEITAVDSVGRQWLHNAYMIQLRPVDFLGKEKNEPAEALFNRIANDLAEALKGADAAMRQRIHRTSQIAFAARVSPEPFADYLGKGPDGYMTLRHLPADDDPAWKRIQAIHGRDRVFSELVNRHYETFNTTLQEPYAGWRKEIVGEREAMQQVRREGRAKTSLGAVLIGSAIALQVAGVKNAGAASAILGIAGAQQVIEGVNTLKQQKMHQLALEELTRSFANAAEPIVIDFEGQQVELQGTAEEQYRRWQILLKKMYQEETGFAADDPVGARPAP